MRYVQKWGRSEMKDVIVESARHRNFLLHHRLFLPLPKLRYLFCVQLCLLLPISILANMPSLSVAMYKPFEGNHLHWALYLEDGSKRSIYEVLGEHPHFKANLITGKTPDHTVRHQRSIFVYEINSPDLPEFEKAICSVEPQNDIALWNCQDYVIEILERLEEECIIDGEDKMYIKAKKEVKKYFGPL